MDFDGSLLVLYSSLFVFMYSKGFLSVLIGSYASLCVLMSPNGFLQVLIFFWPTLYILSMFFFSTFVQVRHSHTYVR